MINTLIKNKITVDLLYDYGDKTPSFLFSKEGKMLGICDEKRNFEIDGVTITFGDLFNNLTEYFILALKEK